MYERETKRNRNKKKEIQSKQKFLNISLNDKTSSFLAVFLVSQFYVINCVFTLTLVGSLGEPWLVDVIVIRHGG